MGNSSPNYSTMDQYELEKVLKEKKKYLKEVKKERKEEERKLEEIRRREYEESGQKEIDDKDDKKFCLWICCCWCWPIFWLVVAIKKKKLIKYLSLLKLVFSVILFYVFTLYECEYKDKKFIFALFITDLTMEVVTLAMTFPEISAIRKKRNDELIESKFHWVFLWGIYPFIWIGAYTFLLVSVIVTYDDITKFKTYL